MRVHRHTMSTQSGRTSGVYWYIMIKLPALSMAYTGTLLANSPVVLVECTTGTL